MRDNKHDMAVARGEKVDGRGCRLCGNTWGIEAHHIVHRGKMPRGRKNPLMNHPDNIMPLCHAHHQDHHTTTNRVPREALKRGELAFLLEHAGRHWAGLWYKEATDE